MGRGLVARRVLWTTYFAAAMTIQVLVLHWARVAVDRRQVDCVPDPSGCPELRHHRLPVVASPAAYVAFLLAVDLALLLLALWVVARHKAWSPATLGRRAAMGAAVVGTQLGFGYWWAMAYALGPHQSSPGECLSCFEAALREQNGLEAVSSGLIVLAWMGATIALVVGLSMWELRAAARE